MLDNILLHRMHDAGEQNSDFVCFYSFLTSLLGARLFNNHMYSPGFIKQQRKLSVNIGTYGLKCLYGCVQVKRLQKFLFISIFYFIFKCSFYRST